MYLVINYLTLLRSLKRIDMICYLFICHSAAIYSDKHTTSIPSELWTVTEQDVYFCFIGTCCFSTFSFVWGNTFQVSLSSKAQQKF